MGFRILYFILLLLTCHLNGYSQKETDRDDCSGNMDKSFISDGIDHQMVISGTRPTQLNVIFLPHFAYRLEICGNNNDRVVLKLKDDFGNILYSNKDAKMWDFQFDTYLKGTIELRLYNENMNEKVISLIIGYKLLGK